MIKIVDWCSSTPNFTKTFKTNSWIHIVVWISLKPESLESLADPYSSRSPRHIVDSCSAMIISLFNMVLKPCEGTGSTSKLSPSQKNSGSIRKKKTGWICVPPTAGLCGWPVEEHVGCWVFRWIVGFRHYVIRCLAWWNMHRLGVEECLTFWGWDSEAFVPLGPFLTCQHISGDQIAELWRSERKKLERKTNIYTDQPQV